MNCAQVAEDELVEKYVSGRLEPPLQDDFEVHILECAKCRGDLETWEEVRSGLAARADEIRQDAGSLRRFRAWVTPLRVAGVAALASAALAIAIVGVRIVARRSQGNSTASTTSPKTTSPPSTANTALDFPEIAALSVAEQRSVLEAIHSRNISYPPELAELRGRQETLMSDSQDGANFHVLGPLGEVVFDPRPLFRWQPVAGASGYSVTVFDPKLNLVQTSPALHAAQWRANRPLQRGQLYLWQVKATMSDGRSVISPSAPSPEAKFRILDQAKADQFEQFRQAHPDAHLVLGILYAQAGILEEAKRELKQLPQNDSNYPLAQQLLKSIERARSPQ
jgi:hypothetical protein